MSEKRANPQKGTRGLKKTAAKKAGKPEISGFSEVDRLYRSGNETTFADYLVAVSQYVKEANEPERRKKRAQGFLSKILARAIVHDLRERIPEIATAQVGERRVAGALQGVQVDASQYHELDGLRLAVEIKPTYLAVGRAIWNRCRDIRAFAINIHLKFPLAVLGGVLVIPSYDLDDQGGRAPTAQLTTRVVRRLEQTGRRRNEADAPHLLEAIAVIHFDPESGAVDPNIPSERSGLRWEGFIRDLAAAYDGRFGEGTSTDSVEDQREDS